MYMFLLLVYNKLNKYKRNKKKILKKKIKKEKKYGGKIMLLKVLLV